MRKSEWDWLVRSGEWGRVHAGVIRLVGAPETWEQAIMAGTMAADGVASHGAAGFLWGIPGIQPALEITISETRRVRLTGFRVHLTADLSPDDHATRKGIPVTSLARTVIDLCLQMPEKADAILDHVLAKKRVTLSRLIWLLGQLGTKGRKGAARLNALLEERRGRSRHVDSGFQRTLEAVITAASKAGRLPPAVFELRVVLPDGRERFIDAAFPGTGHGVEADTYEYHSTQEDWERDHTRNLELMEVGWITIPITPRMLRLDPDRVVRLIASILVKAGVWRPPGQQATG